MFRRRNVQKRPCHNEKLGKKGPSEFAQIQRQIVKTAAKMLKPGGMMLYSTCTFAPEENEGTISYLLDENEDFEIVKLPEYEGFCSGKPEWLDKDFTC